MKIIAFLCTFSVMLLAGSVASASTLTLAQVGSLDTLIGATTLGDSGDDTEKDWIADVLGIPSNELTYSKVTSSGGANWQSLGGSVFAFDLGSEPGWFMLKTGNGATYRNFLFENLGSLQYAAIDFNDLGFGSINIGKISHVSAAGDPTSVPEPVSLAGLGAGLAAIAVKLRRQKPQAQ